MGFWSTVGNLALKAGSAALQEGKGAVDRSKQYKEEMPEKSDDDLLRIIKKERSSSPLRNLCITSFSAFPTQLNQQVTSANLSEIGVMQRFLKGRRCNARA